MLYPKKVPHGIMFHHFHGGTHVRSQGSLSQDDFKNIVSHLGVKRFLSPAEWLEGLAKKTLRDSDLCLTFDDGLLSQPEIALPVLDHFKLKAFWFVYSGVFSASPAGQALAGQTGGEGFGNLEIYRSFRTKYFDNMEDFYRLFFSKVSERGIFTAVDEEVIKEQQKLFPFYSINDIQFRFLRDKALGGENYEKIMDSMLEDYQVAKSDLAKNLWMSNQDLKQLISNGHSIGLHSYSHPTDLADLSPQRQLEEYQKNYSHLEEVCGKKPVAMAHPCNSYSNDTLEILKQLGISCGFRSNMFPRRAGDPLNTNALEIAREDHANTMRVI